MPGTSPAFQAAVQELYGISYTLKFMLKQRKAAPDKLKTILRQPAEAGK